MWVDEITSWAIKRQKSFFFSFFVIKKKKKRYRERNELDKKKGICKIRHDRGTTFGRNNPERRERRIKADMILITQKLIINDTSPYFRHFSFLFFCQLKRNKKECQIIWRFFFC